MTVNSNQSDLFAQYQNTRAAVRPTECNDGEPCWVRQGPPALRSGTTTCIGCEGHVRTNTHWTALRKSTELQTADRRARSNAKSITFRGQHFTSQTLFAEFLAKQTGRSASSCRKMLQKYKNNGNRVLEHYSKAAKRQSGFTRGKPITFNGVNYESRMAVARHLTTVTGKSLKICYHILTRYGDDTTRVLEHLGNTQPQPNASESSRGFERTFPTLATSNLITLLETIARDLSRLCAHLGLKE